MKSGENVVSLGNFWDITASAVKEAERAAEEEKKIRNDTKKKKIVIARLNEQENKEQLSKSLEMVDNIKEVAKILKKAGLKASTYFPFTITNEKDKLIPKDPEQMKKDAQKSKEKLEEAFQKGKIKEKEFEMLMTGLNEMLEENGLEQEEVEEKDVDEMYENFEEEVRENIKGLVASLGGEDAFEDMCKEYDDTKDLDERKWKLQEMNSKINQKLGISGKLKFSKDDDLKFENSFIKGGYMISEKSVMENGLKETTVEMMEKAMVRQMMMDKKNEKTKKEKEALFNKIAQEKEKERQEKQALKNKKQARQRMKTFFNS